MSALDPTAGSGGGAGTGPGGGAGTGPTPTGPPSPTPTKSDVFELALALGADVATVYPGRDGKGAVERASRPDFQLPVTPRFSMAEGGRRLVGRVAQRPPLPGDPPVPNPNPNPPPAPPPR